MSTAALAFRPNRGGAPPLRLLPEPEPQNFGTIPADSWKLVTQRAKAILGSLAILAQSRSEFWASYDDVIEATGIWTESGKACAVRTLQRAIAELVAAGVLEANEIGRGFRFLFRIKGRTPRKDTVFRPAETEPSASNLSSPASNLSPPASNLSPPSSRETTTDYTTTPESSSSCAPPPPDGDRLRALGVRVASLWTLDEDFATGLLGHWAKQLACELDRVDHAVMLAERRKSRPHGVDWIRGTLDNWRREGEPPRPAAARPKPTPPPLKVAEPDPLDAPDSAEVDEWFARAADETAAHWQRRNAVDCIKAAVRDGFLDPSVLEGLGDGMGGPPPRNKKAGCGARYQLSPQPAETDDSRGDSSLNGCSKQVSLGDSPLRSALSGRVLTSCSSIRAFPPNPAPPGGS